MITYAEVECHGELHVVRRILHEDPTGPMWHWETGCGTGDNDALDDNVYLSTIANAPKVGCQGVVRSRPEFLGMDFDGTGMLKRRSGTSFWYQDGKLHREDGPAIEWSDGGWEWFFEGAHHRADGPAVGRTSGLRKWYLHDMLHRMWAKMAAIGDDSLFNTHYATLRTAPLGPLAIEEH